MLKTQVVDLCILAGLHLLLFSILCPCTTGTIQSLVVETENGKVLGKYSDAGNSRVFLGIPYGGHVDGENRWTKPKPPADWDGIFDTTQSYPTACPQKCSVHDHSLLSCPPKEMQTENCLYLNVYTPRDATPESNLSVLVFIHGGGFTGGYSTDPLYDGSYLVSSYDIIVVTINYRIGALGFLALERAHIDGNFGIMDQRLALHWVQKNIEHFGGNKDKVTVSGESAGAMSVAIHLTSHESEGLFHQAIVESSAFGVYYREISVETWNGLVFAKTLECPSKHEDMADCLRRKDLDKVIDASHLHIAKSMWSDFLTWAPVVESNKEQSLQRFLHGDFVKVPTIMGTNGVEGLSFVYSAFTHKLPAFSFYEATIFALFPLKSRRVYKEYPPKKPYIDQRPQLTNVFGDYAFYCPTILSATSMAEQSPPPVYSYLFNQSYPDIPHATYNEGCKTHACHGAELYYVFHSYDKYFTEGERKLADKVSRYWANFVKTGNPNQQDIDDGACDADGQECTTSGQHDWPEFSSSNQWASWYMDVDNFKGVLPKDSCEAFDVAEYGRNIFRILYESNEFFPSVTDMEDVFMKITQ